jgi:hypothetical protein
VERGTLFEKEFFNVGTELIYVLGTGTHVPGTRNVAPYHVPGDCGLILTILQNTLVVLCILAGHRYNSSAAPPTANLVS